MAFIASRTIRVGSSISGPSLPLTTGTSTDIDTNGLTKTVVFDFGSLTNHGDQFNNSDDQIEVAATVIFVDISKNTAGKQGSVNALFNYTSGTRSSAIAAEIVQPVLVLNFSKNATSGDAGDVIAVSIRIQVSYPLLV